MAINYDRQESRLKDTAALLAKATEGSPEHDALLARQKSQEDALARKEKTYPAALKRHLRHCSKSHYKDSRGRTKGHVRTLERGERIAKKPGEK